MNAPDALGKPPNHSVRIYHRVVPPSDVAQLLCWYLLLLLFTIFLKYLALDTIYRGGFSTILTHLASDSDGSRFISFVPLLFAKDIVDCAAVVMFLYIVGGRVFKIPTRLLIPASLMLFFTFGALNWIAIKQLKTYLAYDTLTLTIDWVTDNPGPLKIYLRKRNLAIFAIATAASIAPLLVAKFSHSATSWRTSRKVLAALLIGLVPVGALAYGYGKVFAYKVFPFPLQGYWSSSAEAFVSQKSSMSGVGIDISIAELKKRDHELFYPTIITKPTNTMFPAPKSSPFLRHVIIVSLETAPRRYYPIADNPAFPNFYYMTQNAIVSQKHYANTPFTTYANYSIITGTYSSPQNLQLAKLNSDSIAVILKKHNYTTTYIDSFKLNWYRSQRNRRMFESLGFDKLMDNSDIHVPNMNYWQKLAKEKRSFERGMEAVRAAESQGKKALVFIDTNFGHYKWPSRPELESLDSQDKLLEIAGELDKLIGEMLVGLRKENLENEVIVVVTGDHGLRYEDEFSSLLESREDLDVAFNVPLIIYAPGLFQGPVWPENVTSHVDITPTVLDLLGIERNDYLHHGTNVLDPTLKERLTFMMNTRLSPVDSFHWNGLFFSVNTLTDTTEIAPSKRPLEPMSINELLAKQSNFPLALRDPGKTIQTANELFADTVGYFIHRSANPRVPAKIGDTSLRVDHES